MPGMNLAARHRLQCAPVVQAARYATKFLELVHRYRGMRECPILSLTLRTQIWLYSEQMKVVESKRPDVKTGTARFRAARVYTFVQYGQRSGSVFLTNLWGLSHETTNQVIDQLHYNKGPDGSVVSSTSYLRYLTKAGPRNGQPRLKNLLSKQAKQFRSPVDVCLCHERWLELRLTLCSAQSRLTKPRLRLQINHDMLRRTITLTAAAAVAADVCNFRTNGADRPMG